MEDEKRSEDQAPCAHTVVPFEFLAEIGHGENRKDAEGNHFLNGLELGGIEFVGADAVRRYLETIFEEGNAPTGEDHFPERFAAVFKVAVPGERVMKMLEMVSRAMVRMLAKTP